MHACLVTAMLFGFALGCSDDSGDGSGDTNTVGTPTTGTPTTGTMNTATMTTATASSTTGSTDTVTATATSTTGGGDSSVPADGSAEAISAFLEAEGYKEAGWVSVHDAPVPPSIGTPHGTVRVYMSPALVAFRQSNPDVLEEPAVPGAMAVKEMFDDAETLVGKAVIFYPESDVIYYCYGPDGRCSSGRPATTIDAPQYGDASASAVGQCNVCHSGLVFTELP